MFILANSQSVSQCRVGTVLMFLHCEHRFGLGRLHQPLCECSNVNVFELVQFLLYLARSLVLSVSIYLTTGQQPYRPNDTLVHCVWCHHSSSTASSSHSSFFCSMLDTAAKFWLRRGRHVTKHCSFSFRLNSLFCHALCSLSLFLRNGSLSLHHCPALAQCFPAMHC